MDSTCVLCNKKFSTKSNLRAHFKKFHPDQLTALVPYKKYQQNATCNDCNKTFVRNATLVLHVKRFHPDKEHVLLNPKKYNYECDICKKHFSHLKNLRSHYKNHEGIGCESKKSLKCSICGYLDASKSQLYQHFENIHDLTITTKSMNFESIDAFTVWKAQEEKTTLSSFISDHGWSSTKNNKFSSYVCHRSGYYNKSGKGIRHIKTQGSNKINGFCPAEIKVRVCLSSGTCHVKYTNTHAGHTCNDLEHLNLTKDERENFAIKIASKIPFQTILDDVRDSIGQSGLNRTHLLTKKDLHNIQQSFKLNNEAVRHSVDAVSIDSWVKEIENSECVLFYKPQNVSLPEHPNLRKDDFILIIMNAGQLEMLDKFSDDCVCLDGTHGLNPYEFPLQTLLVLDDLREGFPCAFLISSRSDEEILLLFFKSIKDKLGRKIKPRVFMSDMENSFYNAWTRIMDPASFRLFCTWHVDRSWRKNLNKIHSKEKQVMVYKQLRTILQELDQNAFSQMIKTFLELLKNDSDTSDFGDYFKTYYAGNVETWAYCHRLGSGLNTNMHIERMHETIRNIYLNGKVVKRLDKAINALMKFTRDKLLERLITLNKDNTNLQIDDTLFRKEEEEQKILTAISQNNSRAEEDLHHEKEKLRLKLNHDIDSISTRKELLAFKKIITPIEPTLQAIRVQKKRNMSSIIATGSNIHHSKNVSQQRRFYKTRKTGKKGTSGSSNPNPEELNQIALNLLNKN